LRHSVLFLGQLGHACKYESFTDQDPQVDRALVELNGVWGIFWKFSLQDGVFWVCCLELFLRKSDCLRGAATLN